MSRDVEAWGTSFGVGIHSGCDLVHDDCHASQGVKVVVEETPGFLR
jgi:hypothetical protein